MKIGLAVLALSAGIGYLTHQEWKKPIESAPLADQPLTATLLAVPNQPTLVRKVPPKSKFSQMLERPPFSPTRRPPKAVPQKIAKTQSPSPVAAPAPVAAPVRDPQLTVVGIIINPSQQIALVRDPREAKLKRLSRGDEIDGWLVEAILPKRVVLSNQKNLFELKLEEIKDGRLPLNPIRVQPTPATAAPTKP